MAIEYWFSAFPQLNFVTSLHSPQLATVTNAAATWAPGVVTGFVLAWCGWQSRKRLGAWAGALAVLWLGSAILDGLFGAVSSRANLGHFDAMISDGFQVFISSLTNGWVAVLVAISIGAAGCGLQILWRVRTQQPSTPTENTPIT